MQLKKFMNSVVPLSCLGMLVLICSSLTSFFQAKLAPMYDVSLKLIQSRLMRDAIGQNNPVRFNLEVNSCDGCTLISCQDNSVLSQHMWGQFISHHRGPTCNRAGPGRDRFSPLIFQVKALLSLNLRSLAPMDTVVVSGRYDSAGKILDWAQVPYQTLFSTSPTFIEPRLSYLLNLLNKNVTIK